MNDAATDRPPQRRIAADAAAGCERARNVAGKLATHGHACVRRFSAAGRWAWYVGTAMAAVAVHAADDSKIIFPSGAAQATAPSAVSGTGSANVLTLVVALLIAAAGGWYYWRNRKLPAGARGAQNLAVEETRSLGNRQYLVVASYGDEKFLLGVCPGRIDLLSPLGRQRQEESAL